MGLNIADLEYRTREMCDLFAIPELLPDERSTLLATYQSKADVLSFELKAALDALALTDGKDYLALRRLASLRRKHAMVAKSVEKFKAAITKAERAERQAYDIPANVDCTTQSNQPLPKGKRKRRT